MAVHNKENIESKEFNSESMNKGKSLRLDGRRSGGGPLGWMGPWPWWGWGMGDGVTKKADTPCVQGKPLLNLD